MFCASWSCSTPSSWSRFGADAEEFELVAFGCDDFEAGVLGTAGVLLVRGGVSFEAGLCSDCASFRARSKSRSINENGSLARLVRISTTCCIFASSAELAGLLPPAELVRNFSRSLRKSFNLASHSRQISSTSGGMRSGVLVWAGCSFVPGSGLFVFVESLTMADGRNCVVKKSFLLRLDQRLQCSQHRNGQFVAGFFIFFQFQIR